MALPIQSPEHTYTKLCGAVNVLAPSPSSDETSTRYSGLQLPHGVTEVHILRDKPAIGATEPNGEITIFMVGPDYRPTAFELSDQKVRVVGPLVSELLRSQVRGMTPEETTCFANSWLGVPLVGISNQILTPLGVNRLAQNLTTVARQHGLERGWNRDIGSISAWLLGQVSGKFKR